MPKAGKQDEGIVIGVDGGGTHMSACAITVRGVFVLQVDDLPVSYAQQRGRIADPVARLCTRLLRGAGIEKKRVEAVAVCFTGVGRESDRQIVRRALRRKSLAPTLIVESDAVAALTGALGGGPGIVVIAGTGSIGLGRDGRGQIHRAGGWGFLIGDEGSGFAIARDALNAALQDFDGRGPATSLRRMFEEAFGLRRMDEVIPRIYPPRPDRGAIAKLAPIVFGAAQHGDTVASQILYRAGVELGRLVLALLPRLGDLAVPVPLALLGNLFQQKELLLSGFNAVLSSLSGRIEIVVPRFPPAVGAALLGLAGNQIQLDDAMLRRLDDTYGGK